MDYFKRLEFPIAAEASARGGPLVVFRVSGKNLDTLLSDLSLTASDDRKAKYSSILGVDQGLILYFKGPRSFTGEDVVELHVHGSDRICESLMSELKMRGISEALPGEFSFRAVMNEKMTLAEAESLHVALGSGRSSPLATQLVNLSSHAQKSTEELFSVLQTSLTAARGRLESAIDFSEAEEEQKSDVSSCEEKLEELHLKLEEFLTSYENFSFQLREPRVLIVGEANSGKSSLLNLLLGAERSIVSDTPGTTRDYIEARVTIDNQRYVFVDTAGIRGLEGAPVDDVERRGIHRAIEFVKEAHIVLWVRSSQQPVNKEIEKLLLGHPCVIAIQSFGDLSKDDKDFDLRSDAKKLRGLLEVELKKIHIYRQAKSLELFLSDRQLRLLSQLKDSILSAQVALRDARPIELVAEDLKEADRALKNCRGLELSNDYLSEIFSQFCLGK